MVRKEMNGISEYRVQEKHTCDNFERDMSISEWLYY